MSFNPYDWTCRKKINITALPCIDDESLVNSFTIEEGGGYIATGIDVGTKVWSNYNFTIEAISDCLKQKCFYRGPYNNNTVTLTYNGEGFVDVYVSQMSPRNGGDADILVQQSFVRMPSLICNTTAEGSNREIFYKRIKHGESFTMHRGGTGDAFAFAIFSCDCQESASTDHQILLKIGESPGSSDFDFHLDNRSAKFPSQQDDGGDLRFSLDDGTTLLPFWVEKVEGTAPNRTAYVWVKVNADLSIDQSIFCYFGNPNAENASNGEETFELFNVQGITAFYHLDEDFWSNVEGEVKDEIGVNNGTAHGGATTVEYGKFGRAGSFDGSDDYVDCGNDESLNLDDEFSIEAWVLPRRDARETFLSKGDRDINNGWTFDHRYDKLSFKLKYNDNYEVASDAVLNSWYHVVAVRYFGLLRLYVNGVLRDSRSDVEGISALSSAPLKIGCRTSNNPDYLEHFKGLIDEVRIYNRALTEEEISKLYNGYMQNMGGIFNVRKPDPLISLSVEEIEVLSPTQLQGTVCDKNGNPIIGTAVKVFFFDKDTGELIGSTTSNSMNGNWSYNFGFPVGTKVLAVFALEGNYGEDTDIAGAEFLEVE